MLSSCASQQKQEVFTSSSEHQYLFENVAKQNIPEVRYGYQVYLRMLADADIETNPRIVNYIQDIGKSLAKHAERKSFPYVFTVINDPRAFATSTSGGYIYISTGMITFLKEKDMISVVLAHEIAMTQRRRMRFQRKKHFANLIQSLSSYAPYAMGPAGAAVPKGVRLVNNVLLSEKSRMSRVIEADEIAIDYLKRENVELSNYIDVLKKCITVDAQSYELLKDYLRLRPITDKRVRFIKEQIKNVAQEA